MMDTLAGSEERSVEVLSLLVIVYPKITLRVKE
jgi:hypothetical protein